MFEDKEIEAQYLAKQNVLHAIRNNHVEALSTHLKELRSTTGIFADMSLLDYAILWEQYDAAAYLSRHRSDRKMTDEQIAETRRNYAVINSFDCTYGFELKFIKNRYCLEFYVSNPKGEGNRRISLTEQQLSQNGYAIDNVRVLYQNGETRILIANPNNVAQPYALLRIDNQWHMHLDHLSPRIRNYHIKSCAEVHVEESLRFCNLSISANQLKTDKKAKLDGHQVEFNIHGDIDQQGILVAKTFDATCDNYTHAGQSLILQNYKIQARGRFDQKGSLTADICGEIHASGFENHQGSCMQVNQGELKIYGKNYVRNSGVLVSRYLVLNSQLLVINYAGALIKAVTCTVPPNAKQFNNAGFYLIGNNPQTSGWDKVLNLTGAGLKSVELLSLLPTQQIKNLQLGFAVTKALYHGANIANKIYQGRSDEISEHDWVHYFLDHVIPLAGSLANQEAQSSLFVMICYQLWGWHLGEQEVLEKTMSLLEIVIRGINTVAGGRLSPETVKILENAASALQYSRQAVKVSTTIVDAFHEYYKNDKTSSQNAYDAVSALAESITRDVLATIPPVKIFDLELNPKDLALFAMNKGFSLPAHEILQRGVYSAIYVLHKSDYLSDDVKADWQYGAQLLFSMKQANVLYHQYQSGSLSYSQALEYALTQVAAFASHKVEKDTIAKKNLQQQQNPEEEAEVLLGDMTDGEQTNSQDEILVDSINVDALSEELPGEFQEPASTDDLPILENSNPDEIKDEVDENADAAKVEFERQTLTMTVDVDGMVESMLAQSTDTEQHAFKLPNLISSESVSVLQTFLRCMRGESDYVNSGFLGSYASVFHNQGMVDSSGNIMLALDNGDNSNYMRAAGNLHILGSDVDARDEQRKIQYHSEKAESLSAFTNDRQGVMQAGNDIDTFGLGSMHNQGNMHATNYRNVYGMQDHKNDGSLIAQNDIDIHADTTAINGGTIFGQRVVHEGLREKSENNGLIAAHESVDCLSDKSVHLSQSSQTTAKRVALTANKEIIKDGSVKASLLTLIGLDGDSPDSIVLHGHADDQIAGMKIPASKIFEYDETAFNGVKVTDLRLESDVLDRPSIVENISPDFQNVLQVTVPESDKAIDTSQLPQLNPNATFILAAPGATLDGTNNKDFNYPNTLHFIGKLFEYDGKIILERGCFDVGEMIAKNGESYLALKNGGAIQAKLYDNPGHLVSEGVILWNVDLLENNAQLKEVIAAHIHSKNTFQYDYHTDQHLVAGSGTIYAEKHQGYIGQLNEQGGKLLSGDGGNFLYIANAELKPIWEAKSQYTLGYVEDIGMSWHVRPVAHEAEIGSTGLNILLGTGKLKAMGVNIWGDQGLFVHFNEGIFESELDSRTLLIQEAYSKEGHKRICTVPRQETSVSSKNSISSNHGDISLASANGSINLLKTAVTSHGDTSLVARQTISIDGKENLQSESMHYKETDTLLEKTSIDSDTQKVNIECSYLFVGGTLKVSCLEFNLGAVQGVVGHAQVTAMTTKLSGKEASYQNTTKVKSFSLGLPTDNLVSILSDHNAKAVFSTLIQNSGWSEEELSALLNAKSISEVPGHLIATGKSIWDITALVSHVCNAAVGHDFKEAMGSVTDQLGLTTFDSNGNRIFNANVQINASKLKEQTEYSEMIATNLYVGGTFSLKGNKLIVADGSKVDAQHMLIALAEGIEMTCGKKSYHHDSSLKQGSFGVNVLNPTSMHASGSHTQQSVSSTTHQLASLNARDFAYITAGQSIAGEGKITAERGTVKAPTMSFTSVQDTRSEKSKTVGGGISTDVQSVDSALNGGVHGNYQSNQSSSTTLADKAGISIANGNVACNQLHLANGSVVRAAELGREDGAEGLPTVTGTSAVDSAQVKQKGFNVQGNIASLEGFGTGNYLSDKQEVTHQPSVYASNVGAGDLPGINTNPETESEVTFSKRKAVSLAFYNPNQQKLEQQKEDIGKAFGKADKALHFLFKPSQTTQSSQSSHQGSNLETDAEAVESNLPQLPPVGLSYYEGESELLTGSTNTNTQQAQSSQTNEQDETEDSVDYVASTERLMELLNEDREQALLDSLSNWNEVSKIFAPAQVGVVADNPFSLKLSEYKESTESFIGAYENDGGYANAAINNTYLELAKADPYFIWFAGAALGSSKVGENLAWATGGSLATLQLNDQINLILKQLPFGNQLIFKDIVPTYLLYKAEGLGAVQALQGSDKITDALLTAFSYQAQLDNIALQTAREMGLPTNHPDVMNAVFSNTANVQLALESAKYAMKHEQKAVQDMYTDQFCVALTNSTFVSTGEALGLTGVKVDGQYYSFAKEVPDPANLAQREAYFEKILTAISQLYADSDKRNTYLNQVQSTVNTGTFNLNPYVPTTYHDSLSYVLEAQQLQLQANALIQGLSNQAHDFVAGNLSTKPSQNPAKKQRIK